MGSSPPSTTEKEYGRRLYVSDLTYQGQIRKPTDKAFDDLYKLPHSENKKPYMEDSYEEMEYFQSPPFGFPWDFSDFDAPWMPKAGGGEPITPPWLLVFTCQVLGSPCFCDDSIEKCYTINCSHPIVEASIDPLGDPGDVSLFSVTANAGEICITGKTGAEGAVRINILMQAEPEEGSIVYGEYGPILMYECDDEDCECGAADAFLTFTIPVRVWRTVEEDISFTGGTPPFTWSAVGSDVTIKNNPTTLRSNKLVIGDTACGCVGFDVVDACGRTLRVDVGDPAPSARVVEGSAWDAWGGTEEVEFCEAGLKWGDTDDNQACDHNCWKHYDQRGGPWWDCNCRCSDYIHTHSNSEAACWFNCTVQVGARALRYCRISISSWGCV